MMAQSGLKSARRGRNPWTPLKSSTKPITIASACVESVAIAAPATPMAGIGPQPKMKSGSKAKLRMTVRSTISIGTCTTPMPAHQRLVDKKAEHENEADECELQEADGIGQNVRFGFHQAHDRLAEKVARRGKHECNGEDHDQRLQRSHDS